MKNIIYTIILFLGLCSIISCNKDFDVNSHNIKSFSITKDIDYITTIIESVRNSRNADLDIIDYMKEKLKDNPNVIDISEYNNMCLISMTNQFSILIDFKSHISHISKLKTQIQPTFNYNTDSRGWGQDSLIKDQSVLIWSPFNNQWSIKMTDSITDIFNNYIGYRNVTTIVDYDCDRYSVSKFSDYGMIVIDTHGSQGRFIYTRDSITEIDKLMMEFDSTYYRKQGLYYNILENDISKYWMVSTEWLSDYMDFYGSDGRYLIFNGSCTSADSEEFKNLFFQKGADVYIGFEGQVPVDTCASNARSFFLHLLKDKFSCHKSMRLLKDTSYIKYWHIEDVEDIYYSDNLKSDSMILHRINSKYNIGWDTTTSLSSWYGITLNNNRVYGVDLSYKNLTGDLDSTFFNLSGITTLTLNNNNLTGSIPYNINNCPNLINLDLSNNDLAGTIPYSMKFLYDKNFSTVFLAGNNMNGLIPFGLYSDNKTLFSFDNRYTYDTEAMKTYDYGTGLYYSDEPVYPVIP